MQERLEPFGGSGVQVVFAHANGYPPGSYRQFIAPLLNHCQVTGFKHRALWSAGPPPARLNWSYFSRDLANTLKATFDEPVWLMGHSMGAVISMMVALRWPKLVRGLILIDPVFFPTRHTLSMRLTTREKLRSMPMIRKTLNRPDTFASRQDAFDFHRAKRPFADISDEVLWDYIRAGTKPTAGGEFELAYGRDWEAGVYASPPWVWPRLARLRLPTLGLRGEHSDTLTEQALERWGRLQPNAELRNCAGGHLLPLEQPASTAGHVIDFLSRQAS